MKAPFCPSCKYFNRDDKNCKAYPDGIPKNLYWGIDYHLWPRKEQVGEYTYQSSSLSGLNDSIYELLLNKGRIEELEQEINLEAGRIFDKINNLSSNEFKRFDFFLERKSSDLIIIEEKLLLFYKTSQGNELISIGFSPKLYNLIYKLLLHYSSVEDIRYIVYSFSYANAKGEFKYYKDSKPSNDEYRKVSSDYNRAKHRLENYHLEKQGYRLLTGEELVKFVKQKISKSGIDFNKNKWRLLSSFKRNKYIVDLAELESLIGMNFY